MKRIAKFEKVSFEQFVKDWEETVRKLRKEDYDTFYDGVYNKIKLPKRATKDSAGHDFFATRDIILEPNESMKIPTGIRVKMEEGWVLQCYPKSGLGFKYRLQMDNTVSIIDGDYFYSDNEGHIFAKITNDTNENKKVIIRSGEGFMQGIFVEYGITYDDDTDGIRNGGFGSTGE